MSTLFQAKKPSKAQFRAYLKNSRAGWVRFGEAISEVRQSVVEIVQERGYPVKRQVPIGANIYGHPTRVDLVIERLPGFEAGLIIESKWQAVAGSTDEKYVFLAQNIKQCYPHPTIILADGGGAKPGAIKWLKTQVDGHKLIGVFSLNELLNWIIDRGI